MGMRHVATRRARKACSRMRSRGASRRRTSITEQTDGRAMDAQPKPNRRLVPGHLTAAEHVIASVPGDKPGTSWAVFIGASGGCQRLFALVAPGEGTPSGRHPRHSEAADQCAPPCRLHLLSTMPNTSGNRTKASSSRIATPANTSPAPACCNSAPPTSTSTSFALARWCTPSGSPSVAMPPCASV